MGRHISRSTGHKASTKLALGCPAPLARPLHTHHGAPLPLTVEGAQRGDGPRLAALVPCRLPQVEPNQLGGHACAGRGAAPQQARACCVPAGGGSRTGWGKQAREARAQRPPASPRAEPRVT